MHQLSTETIHPGFTGASRRFSYDSLNSLRVPEMSRFFVASVSTLEFFIMAEYFFQMYSLPQQHLAGPPALGSPHHTVSVFYHRHIAGSKLLSELDRQDEAMAQSRRCKTPAVTSRG